MTDSAQAPRLARERSRLALALALLTLVLGLTGLLRGGDDALYDIGLAIDTRPASSDDIVVIAIDDASLAAMGRWPWPRATHAQLLERIAIDRPRAVLLDLLLSEPADDPDDDAALAAAIDHAGPLVLPVVPVANAAGDRLSELLPADSVGQGYRLGHADAEIDPDGILRRSYLHAGLGAPRHPHVALALLDAAGDRDKPMPGALDLLVRPPRRADGSPLFPSRSADGHWRRADEILLRYRGADRFPHVSYADVLLGRVPPGRFHDRFVLIGVTATGLGDGYVTPLSSNARLTPSIDIIATLLDSLRRDDAPRAPRPVPAAIIGALLAGLVVLGITRLAPRAALGLALGCAAGAVALAWTLLGVADLWFPPTGVALAALLSYPLWSWRRLEAASRFVDDELDTLAHRTGPELGLADGLRSPRALRRGVIASRATGGMPASVRHVGDVTGATPLEARLDALAAISQSLRDGRDLLAEALAALPEPVFVVDPQGLVLLANPPSMRLVAALVADDAAPPPATLAGRQLPQLLRELLPRGEADWLGALDEVHADARPCLLTGRHPRVAPQRIHISPLGRRARPDALVVCLNTMGRATLEVPDADDPPAPPPSACANAPTLPADAPAPGDCAAAGAMAADAPDTATRANRPGDTAARPRGSWSPPSFADALVSTVTGGESGTPAAATPRPPAVASRPATVQPLSGDFVQAMRLESGATVSIDFDIAALLTDAIAEVRAEPGGHRLPVAADAPASATMKGDPALMRRALAGLVAHTVRAGGNDDIRISLVAGASGWQLVLQPAAAGMPSDFVEKVVAHHGGKLDSTPDGAADRARLVVHLPADRA